MINQLIENTIEILPVITKKSTGLLTSISGTAKTINALPDILFITSYPPRECGIATYSQDLVKALNNKFKQSFDIKICPLESQHEKHHYGDEIEYILDIHQPNSFTSLAKAINANDEIAIVMIQHEFGLFGEMKKEFHQFIKSLEKPIIVVFHTVLPHPDLFLKTEVEYITNVAVSIVVMTASSALILINNYKVPTHKITVIPHGTHLVPHLNKDVLKKKYQLQGRKVLSTFGLLSSGKSIETTLDALPAAIKNSPEILFLIIGKTHPSVVKHEGEQYREMLEAKVLHLGLQQHVQFINYFLPLPDLLEYLQLTDIYLFTSRNPNQAVSGTFAYAVSCGCPIISTPIPHSKEVLKEDAGIIFDFDNVQQLSKAMIHLLNDEQKRTKISLSGLHKIASTAWENAAIAHALLFEKIAKGKIHLHYNIPGINLNHVKKLTTGFGIIQFSNINHPDITTGYTLDDNARAMVAMCQHYVITKDESDIKYIALYLNFIKFCLQPDGHFQNYVDEQYRFTIQNGETNLEDSNGRAIWALGYLVSLQNILPEVLIIEATITMSTAIKNINKIYSTRAMAFIIKGLYYSLIKIKNQDHVLLLKELADRMLQMYKHEQDGDWNWYESYLTYGNSILPEAMLCAWMVTNEPDYLKVAKKSFDFLLQKTFTAKRIKVISNKTWLNKDATFIEGAEGGEQPIDIAYTIIALSKFYDVFKDKAYLVKMELAFSWFLGNNHLHQIIYNPCTGGCYDGLEENNVNLNQGAESTVSYLMARLTIEKDVINKPKNFNRQLLKTNY